MNSVPMNRSEPMAMPTTVTATAIVRDRCRIGVGQVAQVALAQAHEPRAPRGACRPSCSRSDEAAGTAVSDSSSEPKMAEHTVIAIGRNIFPSSPSSVKIGR